jgi:hypothetical protein
VHEELLAMGAEVSYPALTAFCRHHRIGVKEKKPFGEYHFSPGEEIQHDTSPHRAEIGGVLRKVQTAAAVMCYSRMLYCQGYPTFNRFYCKVFLTEAVRYFSGACKRMMIDNTHVVVLRGTGAGMVPVPEMAAFADRFGFEFEAHEKGDANRSARVEGVFHFIDNNFLAGRTFSTWADLNEQAVAWCDKVNATFKRSLHAKPIELWTAERPHLQPLPVWIPEVYELHHRTVDARGYVTVHTNRYTVPFDWIGRPVEVQETKDQITISLDHRRRVSHQRLIDPERGTVSLPEHRPPRGMTRKRPGPCREEQALAASFPALNNYVASLKKKGRKQTTLALKQLLRMAREYPYEPLLAAINEAAHYGLYDLDRVERMVLERIANDYFRFDPPPGDDDDER